MIGSEDIVWSYYWSRTKRSF